MHVDLPLGELRSYRPELTVPHDLDDFWAKSLEDARGHPLDATFIPYDSPLRTVDVFDVSFRGYGGQAIAGWLLLPRERSGTLPCVVEYLGYGNGRGLSHESLQWSAFGYAHLVMDTRGQGSTGSSGVTPDLPGASATPHAPGFLTLGLPDRDNYYYRRVYVDAVRAVEAARTHPDVDPARITAAGVSQGGGVALAVAGLDPRVAAVLADVPFLSNFRRAAEMATTRPYDELVTWCHTHRDRAEDAFAALAYFDAAALATRASAPALFSVALRDAVCPPSTVFAAYNSYATNTGSEPDTEIRVWEWNEHEGGGAHQQAEQVAWLNDRI